MAQVPMLPFFQIDLGSHQEIITGNYGKQGSIIQLPTHEICPLAKKTFQQLREVQEKHSLPYAIIHIQCKKSSLFCDGTSAIRWLETSFTNPTTKEAAERVDLFVQGVLHEPFRLIECCAKELSQKMKNCALACSSEISQEVQQCRKAYLLKGPPYLFHWHDLVPIFEKAIEAYPDEPHLRLLLGDLYYCGSKTLGKNFAKAAACFEFVIQKDPRNIHAFHMLGEISNKGKFGITQDLQKAEFYLLAAIKTNPKESAPLESLVTLYCNNAASQKAVFFLESVIKTYPKNVAALDLLAGLYCDGPEAIVKNPHRAEQLWRSALVFDSTNTDILNELAALYRNGGDDFPASLPQAIRCWEEILAMDPKNVEALVGLGNALTLKEADTKYDLIKAEKLLLQAIAIEPKNDDALSTLGQLYYCVEEESAADYKKAAMYLDAAYKINPEIPLVWRLLGQLLLDGAPDVPHDVVRAVKLLEASLISFPREFAILLSLAKVYLLGKEGVAQNAARAVELWKQVYGLVQNKYFALSELAHSSLQEAIKLFRQALAQNPDDLAAQEILGGLLLDDSRGLPVTDIEGVALLEDVIEKHPQDPAPRILLGLFWLHGGGTHKKDHKKAIRYFEQALGRDPDNMRILSLLALCYFNGTEEFPRDPTGAALLCQHILELDAHNIDAKKYLAEILRVGTQEIPADSQKAFKLFREAQRAAPHDPFILTGQGLLALDGKDHSKDESLQAKAALKQRLKFDIYAPSIDLSWLAFDNNQARQEALERARVAFWDALKFDPYYQPAKKGLADVQKKALTGELPDISMLKLCNADEEKSTK